MLPSRPIASSLKQFPPDKPQMFVTSAVAVGMMMMMMIVVVVGMMVIAASSCKNKYMYTILL